MVAIVDYIGQKSEKNSRKDKFGYHPISTICATTAISKRRMSGTAIVRTLNKRGIRQLMLRRIVFCRANQKEKENQTD